VRDVAYVGRSPHEAFFTPDGKEVWVSVRGENYIAVLDGSSFREKLRIEVPNGPGMTIFSPDGKYGYICSSFSPETVVVASESHQIVGRVKQESPFCPDNRRDPRYGGVGSQRRWPRTTSTFSRFHDQSCRRRGR
jgi:DNA-binding beta-propeller fold protein YncE